MEGLGSITSWMVDGAMEGQKFIGSADDLEKSRNLQVSPKKNDLCQIWNTSQGQGEIYDISPKIL